MKSNFPLVSFISVNFNAHEATLEFLDSISDLKYPNYEVIIVDNASDFSSEDLIKQQFPSVTYVQSEENLGFAGGNNLGIKNSKGAFLFFVNNDTVLTEGVVESLISVFDALPKVAGVSPKIIYEGTDIIQYAGYTELTLTARNSAIGNGLNDGEAFNKVKETPYLHGAAMMISREAYEEVGLMSEDYFLYYEELDWSQRFRNSGFELYVDQRVSIYHKASVSVGKNSPLKTYYMMRNRWLFVRKNCGFFQNVFYSFYVSLIVFPKDVLKYLFKREWAQLSAVLRGYFWNYRILAS